MLELLVGITVFSLVLAILYSGFRLGTRSWEAGESGAQTWSELRLASGFLRRQLGKTFPLAINDGGTWRLWFEGTRERLVFLIDSAPRLGQSGLYEMTLSVDGTEERQLTVARRSLRDLHEIAPGDRHERPRPLIDDVVTAEFAYFGTMDGEAEPDWHNSWEDPAHLPRLVRIRLATRSVGRWPDLVVGVNADGIRYQRAIADDERRTTAEMRIHRRRVTQ